jgi:hypothetical protein
VIIFASRSFYFPINSIVLVDLLSSFDIFTRETTTRRATCRTVRRSTPQFVGTTFDQRTRNNVEHRLGVVFPMADESKCRSSIRSFAQSFSSIDDIVECVSCVPCPCCCHLSAPINTWATSTKTCSNMLRSLIIERIALFAHVHGQRANETVTVIRSCETRHRRRRIDERHSLDCSTTMTSTETRTRIAFCSSRRRVRECERNGRDAMRLHSTIELVRVDWQLSAEFARSTRSSLR